jgi:hypothetical protein
MTAGLIQLISYGYEDKPLIYNPEITFFKIVYKRYSLFSFEELNILPENNIDFGKKSIFKIKNFGDLLFSPILQIDLPTVSVNYNTSIDNEIINRQKNVISNVNLNFFLTKFECINCCLNSLSIPIYINNNLIINSQYDNISINNKTSNFVKYLDNDNHLANLLSITNNNYSFNSYYPNNLNEINKAIFYSSYNINYLTNILNDITLSNDVIIINTNLLDIFYNNLYKYICLLDDNKFINYLINNNNIKNFNYDSYNIIYTETTSIIYSLPYIFSNLNLLFVYSDMNVKTAKELTSIFYITDFVYTNNEYYNNVKAYILQYDIFENNYINTNITPQTFYISDNCYTYNIKYSEIINVVSDTNTNSGYIINFNINDAGYLLFNDIKDKTLFFIYNSNQQNYQHNVNNFYPLFQYNIPICILKFNLSKSTSYSLYFDKLYLNNNLDINNNNNIYIYNDILILNLNTGVIEFVIINNYLYQTTNMVPDNITIKYYNNNINIFIAGINSPLLIVNNTVQMKTETIYIYTDENNTLNFIRSGLYKYITQETLYSCRFYSQLDIKDSRLNLIINNRNATMNLDTYTNLNYIISENPEISNTDIQTNLLNTCYYDLNILINFYKNFLNNQIFFKFYNKYQLINNNVSLFYNINIVENYSTTLTNFTNNNVNNMYNTFLQDIILNGFTDIMNLFQNEFQTLLSNINNLPYNGAVSGNTFLLNKLNNLINEPLISIINFTKPNIISLTFTVKSGYYLHINSTTTLDINLVIRANGIHIYYEADIKDNSASVITETININGIINNNIFNINPIDVENTNKLFLLKYLLDNNIIANITLNDSVQSFNIPLNNIYFKYNSNIAFSNNIDINIITLDYMNELYITYHNLIYNNINKNIANITDTNSEFYNKNQKNDFILYFEQQMFLNLSALQTSITNNITISNTNLNSLLLTDYSLNTNIEANISFESLYDHIMINNSVSDIIQKYLNTRIKPLIQTLFMGSIDNFNFYNYANTYNLSYLNFDTITFFELLKWYIHFLNSIKSNVEKLMVTDNMFNDCTLLQFQNLNTFFNSSINQNKIINNNIIITKQLQNILSINNKIYDIILYIILIFNNVPFILLSGKIKYVYHTLPISNDFNNNIYFTTLTLSYILNDIFNVYSIQFYNKYEYDNILLFFNNIKEIYINNYQLIYSNIKNSSYLIYHNINKIEQYYGFSFVSAKPFDTNSTYFNNLITLFNKYNTQYTNNYNLLNINNIGINNIISNFNTFFNLNLLLYSNFLFYNAIYFNMFATFKFQNNIIDFNSIYNTTNTETHKFCHFVISLNNYVTYFINNHSVTTISDNLVNLYFYYINNQIQLFKFNTFNYYILIDNNICDNETEEIIFYIKDNNIYKTDILTIINNSIYDLTKNISFYIDNNKYYTINSNIEYIIKNDKIYDLLNNIVYYIDSDTIYNKVNTTFTIVYKIYSSIKLNKIYTSYNNTNTNDIYISDKHILATNISKFYIVNELNHILFYIQENNIYHVNITFLSNINNNNYYITNTVWNGIVVGKGYILENNKVFTISNNKIIDLSNKIIYTIENNFIYDVNNSNINYGYINNNNLYLTKINVGSISDNGSVFTINNIEYLLYSNKKYILYSNYFQLDIINSTFTILQNTYTIYQNCYYNIQNYHIDYILDFSSVNSNTINNNCYIKINNINMNGVITSYYLEPYSLNDLYMGPVDSTLLQLFKTCYNIQDYYKTIDYLENYVYTRVKDYEYFPLFLLINIISNSLISPSTYYKDIYITSSFNNYIKVNNINSNNIDSIHDIINYLINYNKTNINTILVFNITDQVFVNLDKIYDLGHNKNFVFVIENKRFYPINIQLSIAININNIENVLYSNVSNYDYVIMMKNKLNKLKQSFSNVFDYLFNIELDSKKIVDIIITKLLQDITNKTMTITTNFTFYDEHYPFDINGKIYYIYNISITQQEYDLIFNTFVIYNNENYVFQFIDKSFYLVSTTRKYIVYTTDDDAFIDYSFNDITNKVVINTRLVNFPKTLFIFNGKLRRYSILPFGYEFDILGNINYNFTFDVNMYILMRELNRLRVLIENNINDINLYYYIDETNTITLLEKPSILANNSWIYIQINNIISNITVGDYMIIYCQDNSFYLCNIIDIINNNVIIHIESFDSSKKIVYVKRGIKNIINYFKNSNIDYTKYLNTYIVTFYYGTFLASLKLILTIISNNNETLYNNKIFLTNEYIQFIYNDIHDLFNNSNLTILVNLPDIIYRTNNNVNIDDYDYSNLLTFSNNNKIEYLNYKNVIVDMINIIHRDPIPKISWIKYLGNFILDSINFFINDESIELLTSQIIHNFNYYNTMPSLHKSIDKMIGNTLHFTKKQPVISGGRLYVPLPFFFQKNEKALPIISLINSQLYMNFNISKLEHLIKLPDNCSIKLHNKLNINLISSFVFLDNDERKLFAESRHEYLIELKQCFPFTVNNSNNNLKLNLDKPVKDFIWFYLDNSVLHNKDYWNYMGFIFNDYDIDNILFNDYDIDDDVSDFIKNLLLSKQNLVNHYNGRLGLSFIDMKPLPINILTSSQISQLKNFILERNININPFIVSELQFNGHSRFIVQDILPSLVYPLQNYKYYFKYGINVYNFGLYPNDLQHSGACNFKFANNIYFKCNLKSETVNGTIFLITRTYNILRIASGFGCCAW